MKYINQLDFPHHLYVTRTDVNDPGHERGKTTTIKSSGCGLCSAVMVADRLLPGCDFDLYDAIELSYAAGANNGRGTKRHFFTAFAQKLGLRLEFSDSIEDLCRCLRTGGAAIALVGCKADGTPGLFTNGGHYITVINEEPDGRLAILDPSYREGKYEEEGRKGKVEVRNGVIALCDPQVLHEETQPKQPQAYFLFWRA